MHFRTKYSKIIKTRYASRKFDKLVALQRTLQFCSENVTFRGCSAFLL